MVVADTTFLIDVLAGDDMARSKLEGLAATLEPLWIPAPALQELYYGATLHRRAAEERERVEDLESKVPVLPLDARAAKLAGILEGELEAQGRRPSRADVQIAAIALARQEAVLTRDTRFPSPEGLRLVVY